MANFFDKLFGSNVDSNTSAETQNAINQYGNAINKQANINDKYTGNAGYQNSINQGLQGAAVTANQAGLQSQNAARNMGLSKGAAAMMGSQNAANAFGTNFTNQQGQAANLGQQAVQANAMNANQLSNLANINMQEQQNKYNRSAANAARVGNVIGNVGSTLTGLFGLSDERCKDISETSGHISKMLEDIEPYIYKYTEAAQKEYPSETDNKARIGTMAQDLEINPVTNGAVIEDGNGIKHINSAQLAMQAIAAISDLSKRMSEIEKGE